MGTSFLESNSALSWNLILFTPFGTVMEAIIRNIKMKARVKNRVLFNDILLGKSSKQYKYPPEKRIIKQTIEEPHNKISCSH